MCRSVFGLEDIIIIFSIIVLFKLAVFKFFFNSRNFFLGKIGYRRLVREVGMK